VIKRKKHNINIEENPKMDTKGDYHDEEIVSEVVDLLKEYEEIFPRSFLRDERHSRKCWGNEDTIEISCKTYQ